MKNGMFLNILRLSSRTVILLHSSLWCQQPECNKPQTEYKSYMSRNQESSIFFRLAWHWKFNLMDWFFHRYKTSQAVLWNLEWPCPLLLFSKTFLLAHKVAHFQNLSVCAHLDDLMVNSSHIMLVIWVFKNINAIVLPHSSAYFSALVTVQFRPESVFLRKW